MATDPFVVENAIQQRNIPPGMIDDAIKHLYEAAIRTPLVRLNYDGPAEIYLKLACLAGSSLWILLRLPSWTRSAGWVLRSCRRAMTNIGKRSAHGLIRR